MCDAKARWSAISTRRRRGPWRVRDSGGLVRVRTATGEIRVRAHRIPEENEGGHQPPSALRRKLPYHRAVGPTEQSRRITRAFRHPSKDSYHVPCSAIRRQPPGLVPRCAPVPPQVHCVGREALGHESVHERQVLPWHLKIEVGERAPRATVDENDGPARARRALLPHGQRVSVHFHGVMLKGGPLGLHRETEEQYRCQGRGHLATNGDGREGGSWSRVSSLEHEGAPVTIKAGPDRRDSRLGSSPRPRPIGRTVSPAGSGNGPFCGSG